MAEAEDGSDFGGGGGEEDGLGHGAEICRGGGGVGGGGGRSCSAGGKDTTAGEGWGVGSNGRVCDSAINRQSAPILSKDSKNDSIDARVSVLESSQQTEEGRPFLQECDLHFLTLAAFSNNGAVRP